MLRHLVDDEAQEEIDASDGDSVDTEAADEQDEDFIVEVVKRRFGIVEFNVQPGLAEVAHRPTSQLRPYDSLEQPYQCRSASDWVLHNRGGQSSSPTSRGPVGSVPTDLKTTTVGIESQLGRDSSTSGISDRKRVSKKARKQLVPRVPLSERLLGSLSSTAVLSSGPPEVQDIKSDGVRPVQTEAVSLMET